MDILKNIYKKIDWLQETPFDALSGDFYYMPNGLGLGEREYIYLLNRELFSDVKEDVFCIGEIGFGTGLSWSCTLKLWKNSRKNGSISPAQRLLYIAFEQSPLSPFDLKKALEIWRDSLGPEIDSLLRLYKGLTPNLNILPFFEDGAVLLLVIGSAEKCLAQYDFYAHHWMLDGFSPAKNPSAWQESLLTLISARSVQGATLSSFSAAGGVRRDLSKLGWDVQRRPGYRHRKHHLFARWTQGPIKHPYHSSADRLRIMGHGIAGLSLAYFLNFFSQKTVNYYCAQAPRASEAPWIYTKPKVHLFYDEMTAFHLKSWVFSSFFYDYIASDLIVKPWRESYDPGQKEHLLLQQRWESSCKEWIEVNQDEIIYPFGLTASGPALLQRLQEKLTLTDYQAIEPQDCPEVDFLAQAWAASSYGQNYLSTSISRGVIDLLPGNKWSNPSHERYRFEWKVSSSTSFVGFRSQKGDYLPLYDAPQKGKGYSLHHGSRGFSSGPYCALLVILKSLNLFAQK